MTGNVKLCCMVLRRLGLVLRGREFQRLSCPVACWKDCDLCVLSSGLLSRAPRFRGEVVCPAVKDLVCLSELFLIPTLHQYEQSAVAEVFPPASRIPWLSSLELMLTGALGEV